MMDQHRRHPSFPIEDRLDLAAEGAVARPVAGPSARETSATSRQGQGLRVLVVDDEEAQRNILAEILEDEGYQVETASGLAEALKRLDADGVDLVLSDLKMPGGSGIDLLDAVKERDADVEVILMTAFSSVETAVEAMRKGAYHYLPKPFEKRDLLRCVAQLRDGIRLRRENLRLQGLLAERFRFENMLGVSPGMQDVFRTVEMVRSNSATVLIRGESGTGKELVARAIHTSGSRRDRPFVAINCAAIPEMLIESELFGHEKGAFTGAHSAKVGRFEEVEDGTLFLDEIGSMKYDLQAKLLRVIQEREFQRIGGSRMIRFRARIVAATSQDLEYLMSEKRFREDLYFRLNVVPVELPPLREREGDLPLLAHHFLERFARELGKSTKAFDPRVLDLLEEYDWPGNIRELENVIQRMVVLADPSVDTIEPEMLPAPIRRQARARQESAAAGAGAQETQPRGRSAVSSPSGREAGDIDSETSAVHPERPAAHPGDGGAPPSAAFVLPPEGLRLSDLEANLIRQALERAEGRLEPASRLLGITYKTLQYRVKKYGLQAYQKQESAISKETSSHS
ncbi:MAG: sigma-54-dependent Fis family transcriptional regulator [Planctomycetes bacterium]|nr:sigma-54-dependent Fis family transcriptional regulator [Planctomycetota bacterium]